MIAANAQPIVDARLRGMKPEGMILVSLVGPMAAGNHTVHASAGQAYDWRWTRGLDVCVYVGARIDWAATVKAIALHRPEHLNVWNAVEKWGAGVLLVPAAEDIAQPVERWTYELDFLPWLDFQNMDFIAGRTYARAPGGMPHAINP